MSTAVNETYNKRTIFIYCKMGGNEVVSRINPTVIKMHDNNCHYIVSIMLKNMNAIMSSTRDKVMFV